MKMKMAAGLLPVFAAAYLFAFAAPPVYPGAKLVDELNQGLKKAGQDMTAYNTFDAYEKVYDFYQSKGGELRRGRPDRAKEKQATFQFKESGYFVTVLWKEDSKSHGTIIYIGRVARPGA
jgi:hypothetical protein